MALTVLAASAATSPALTATAPAAPAPPPTETRTAPREVWRPPVLTTERYNEDWSILADPANRTGRWTERFKYIPLGSNDDDREDRARGTYLVTGIELRLRNENYAGLGWESGPDADQRDVWVRAMPYADLHVGDLRAFVQPIASYAFGVKPAPSPVDRTGLDMLQLFAQASVTLGKDTRVRISAGRQLVALGSERLVGTRYGPNTPLAFDGVRGGVLHGALTIRTFYLAPVTAGSGDFDDRRSRRENLWGVYATLAPAGPRTFGIDLYYLGFRDEQGQFQQGTGLENRQTLGLRTWGKAKTFYWDGEAMFQFGRFAGAAITAWSLSIKAGTAFSQWPLKPGLSFHADVISGDRDGGSSQLQAFNPLYPKGKYFGELSPVGPYNIIDLQGSITLDLGGNVGLGFATMAYWRQSKGDGVYDIPGHLLRAGNPAQARYIGHQGELVLSWQATPELNLSGSASIFEPGDFLKETGQHQAIQMVAAEGNFRF